VAQRPVQNRFFLMKRIAFFAAFALLSGCGVPFVPFI